MYYTAEIEGHRVSFVHVPIGALYRELVSKIEEYHVRGVLGVDMETSAMYAPGIRAARVSRGRRAREACDPSLCGGSPD